jgi:chromosome segregation ATPase
MLTTDNATVKELKDIIFHLQMQLAGERTRGRSTKLVSGAQFKAPAKDIHRCDGCDTLSQSVRKHKDVIRTLRICISRLEEQLDGLKKHKHEEGTMPLQLQQELDLTRNANAALEKKIEDLTSDIARLRKSKRSSVSKEELAQQLSDMAAACNREVSEARKESASLNTTIVRMNAEKQDMEALQVRLKSSVLAMKQQLEKAEGRVQETLEAMKALQAQDKSSESAREIERLHQALQLSSSSNASLSVKCDDLSEKLAAANSQINALRYREESLQASLVNKAGDHESAVSINNQLRARVNDLERQTSWLKDDADKANRRHEQKEVELIAMKRSMTSLKEDIDGINYDRQFLQDKLHSNQETLKKSIEKAVQSAVRLCVVAPTVNVQVSDKRLKFKASLDEKKLRQFLTQEVLMSFSFLFKQEKEDSSPIAGVPVNVWVQQMLADMQSSIEQHVEAALQ